MTTRNAPLTALIWISGILLTAGVLAVVIAFATIPQYDPNFAANADAIMGEDVDVVQQLNPLPNILGAAAGLTALLLGAVAAFLALATSSITTALEHTARQTQNA